MNRRVLPDFYHSTDAPHVDLVQTIPHSDSRIELSMLRLDLWPSWASGNKYFKLKFLIRDALENHITTIVSKGGMFSNHLDALAGACSHFKINLVCLVRSFSPDEQNPTIRRMTASGAQIRYLPPDVFSSFDENQCNTQYPGALFIPEGGLHEKGVRGAADITAWVKEPGITHMVVAGGSMCTSLGILASLDSSVSLHIVPAWKGCTRAYVENLCRQFTIQPVCTWDIWPDYAFGGFGKWDKALFEFMYAFTTKTGIPLDPVYTGKMMFAIDEKIREGIFHAGDHILAVHSGGLQGIEGYAYRFPEPWHAYLRIATRGN